MTAQLATRESLADLEPEALYEIAGYLNDPDAIFAAFKAAKLAKCHAPARQIEFWRQRAVVAILGQRQ